MGSVLSFGLAGRQVLLRRQRGLRSPTGRYDHAPFHQDRERRYALNGHCVSPGLAGRQRRALILVGLVFDHLITLISPKASWRILLVAAH